LEQCPILSALADKSLLPESEVNVTFVDLTAEIGRSWSELSPREALAALLGIVYVLLAVRESRWCWIFAFASTALYLWVFAAAGLYMQASLQAFFLAAAVYGFVAWRGGPIERPVRSGQLGMHALLMAVVMGLTVVSARILAAETHSQDPFLDALTSWASVAATALQAYKHRENWLWWIAIDLLIAWLCLRQGLPLTAGLYLVYIGLAALGWRSWKVMREAR
jgi:nicotinamide mononucleotide transporter